MPDFMTDVQAIAAAAKSAITEIKAELVTQKNNRDSLLKQKDNLLLQPLTKADIKQAIFDYIDRQAQLYLQNGGMAGIINSLALPTRRTENSLPKPRNRAVNLYELEEGVKPNGGFQSYIFDMENLPIFNGYAFSHGAKADLCFFFGDVIKQKIDAHFDAFFPSDWDSYKPGLPLAERRPQIADLDAQIATVDATIKQLEKNLSSISFSANVKG